MRSLSGFVVLTWEDFDEFVRWADTDADGVYGEPRGGLVPAVAISHALRLPLWQSPRARMLWVDDIADSGRTLEAARLRFPGADFLAWVRRPGQDVRAHLTIDHGWVVFPWEQERLAAADRARYVQGK